MFWRLCFLSIKVQEENNAPQREKQQAAPPEVTVGPSNEVQEKLKELEEEISKFRAENKALAKIRSERDEVRNCQSS